LQENIMTQTPSTTHDNWDQHWQDYTEAAEQNPAQRYRRQVACRLLRRHGCSDASRVLDIGSGQGDLALDLRRAFVAAEIAGIELSATGVEVAARKVPDARFFQCDLLDAAGDPGPLRGWAQYAVCSEVLEHLDEPGTLLKNASAYLAPGCVLVVTVPGGPQSAFDHHIGHRQHFTPASIRALLEKTGFQVEFAGGAGFPFFNLYRLTVIARGKRLITDVQSGSQGGSSLLARVAMAVFRPLFALNLLNSRWGWQTVAVARWQGRQTPIKNPVETAEVTR
jgi:SAM-dependent methyltransferase